jgi:gluconate 2-dehydrogenase gamma chain
MADDTIPRRRFLLGAGLAGTAVAAGLAGEMPLPAQAETSLAPAPAAANPAGAEPEALLLLTATEAAFVSAAVDAFIPADELSPSGSDCGLVIYIDRQLASEWGGGSKMYRGGPFHKGKPEQGYQLALTPRQFFQAGIAEANVWSHKTYGKEFDRLAPADRDAALKAMEEGKAAFGGVSSRAFFNMLLSLAMDGFFADPAYGGNRNAASWKMLGFPGLPATYADKFEEYRNKRYIAPPRSMADFS